MEWISSASQSYNRSTSNNTSNFLKKIRELGIPEHHKAIIAFEVAQEQRSRSKKSVHLTDLVQRLESIGLFSVVEIKETHETIGVDIYVYDRSPENDDCELLLVESTEFVRRNGKTRELPEDFVVEIFEALGMPEVKTCVENGLRFRDYKDMIPELAAAKGIGAQHQQRSQSSGSSYSR